MNKQSDPVSGNQLGRMKLMGIIGLQLLTAVIVIATAFLAFSHYRGKLEAEIEADLLAISELKTYQVSDYIRERVSDAEVLVQRAGVWLLLDPETRRVTQGLSLTASISEITAQLKKSYGYSGIAIYDRDLSLVYPRNLDYPTDPVVIAALTEARKTGNPLIVDLHLHNGKDAQFGIVHPIRSNGSLEGQIIGMVFLEQIGHPNLTRLISSWPTAPSKTGESLLIRIEKDQVTYLSQLRHAPETPPLSMRRPIKDENLLAAKVARGELGVVKDGLDYRGVEVLGAASRITGTPWILITKIDREEARAGIVRLAQIIAFLAFSFLLIASLALHYLWRIRAGEYESHQRTLTAALDSSTRRLEDEHRHRSKIEARYARIFNASPLPKQIHALDDLSIIAINRAHEDIFGYQLEEISSLDDWMGKVYPDQSARETLRVLWMKDIEKIRESDGVIESPEMQMHCRDGRIRVFRGSMSIAHDNIIVIWTDLTELRRSEEALVESERRFRGMVEQTISGFYVVVDGRIAYINPRVTEMTGWLSDEVIGHAPGDFVDEQSGKDMQQAQQLLLSGQRTVTTKLNAKRKDGSTLPLAAYSTLGSWDGRNAIVAILEDLTERTRAEEKIRSYVQQLETSMRSTLEACAKMVELRDPYTAGHQDRVGKIAAAIALEMGWSDKRCNSLELMGLVHDIGKVAVPAEFLTKPTRLSAYEFEIIKNHAQAGYEILKGLQFDDLPVADIVRQHHERMDGSGYPQGLKGEQILPEARVLAVADVLESMASYRPYRPALGIDKALEELEKNSGKLYDTEAVDALIRLVREKHYALP